MTSSSPPSEGGAGAVLSEEDLAYAVTEPRGWIAATIAQTDDSRAMLDEILAVVAALVSQARAEGAAEEREKCATMIERFAALRASVRGRNDDEATAFALAARTVRAMDMVP